MAAARRISPAYEDGTFGWIAVREDGKGGSSCHWPGSSNFYLVMTLPDSGNHSYLSNSEKLKIVHVPRVASTFRSLKISDRRSQITDLMAVYAMEKWPQLILRRAFRKSR